MASFAVKTTDIRDGRSFRVLTRPVMLLFVRSHLVIAALSVLR